MPVVLPAAVLSHGFHRVRGRAPGFLRGLQPVAFGKLFFRLAQELAADAQVLFYLAISVIDFSRHYVPRVLTATLFVVHRFALQFSASITFSMSRYQRLQFL